MKMKITITITVAIIIITMSMSTTATRPTVTMAKEVYWARLQRSSPARHFIGSRWNQWNKCCNSATRVDAWNILQVEERSWRDCPRRQNWQRRGPCLQYSCKSVEQYSPCMQAWQTTGCGKEAGVMQGNAVHNAGWKPTGVSWKHRKRDLEFYDVQGSQLSRRSAGATRSYEVSLRIGCIARFKLWRGSSTDSGRPMRTELQITIQLWMKVHKDSFHYILRYTATQLSQEEQEVKARIDSLWAKLFQSQLTTK